MKKTLGIAVDGCACLQDKTPLGITEAFGFGLRGVHGQSLPHKIVIVKSKLPWKKCARLHHHLWRAIFHASHQIFKALFIKIPSLTDATHESFKGRKLQSEKKYT